MTWRHPAKFRKNILFHQVNIADASEGPDLNIKVNDGRKMIIFVIQVSGATRLGGGFQVYYDRERERLMLFMLAVHYINIPIVIVWNNLVN